MLTDAPITFSHKVQKCMVMKHAQCAPVLSTKEVSAGYGPTYTNQHLES